MPVSTPVHLPYCLSLIVGLAPRSVLDIGLGFGTWGFLCRTHLDVFPGRVQPHEWITRIDGIELFEPYIQAHQRALYNDIQIADVRAAAPGVDRYDLIIAGDVIEHLDKDEAEAVLDALYEKADRALMVNIPIGESGWEHPENHGNPGELHRSAWAPEDFLAYPHVFESFALPNGAYGVFWCPKDVPVAGRFNGLLAAAHRALGQGRVRRAYTLLRMAHALAPGDTLAATLLADTALQLGQIEEALGALEASLSPHEASHQNYLMLAALQLRLGQRDAAEATLARLRQLGNAAPALLAEATALLGPTGQP